MIHSWLKSTDGNGSTARVMLFDFRKAFDLIDHNVFLCKLSSYGFPTSIMLWILDFLSNRKQRVKMSNDCCSEWGVLRAGVPQATKLGPWLFLIMFNDVKISNLDLWKCVDDSTMFKVVMKNELSSMQAHVDQFVVQTKTDGFQLNESKCRELRITFSKAASLMDAITIIDKDIEIVSSANLLGVIVSDDLKWNAHIDMICKKVATRLYFLRQLKRAKLPSYDLLFFYKTCIHPVAEYASPVFHNALPQYLSDVLEKLQKRALRIVYPDLSYTQALDVSGITTLYERRDETSVLLFQQVVEKSNHKLHHLLPPRNNSNICNRRKRFL